MATITSTGTVHTDGGEIEILTGTDNFGKPMIALGFSNGQIVTRKRMTAASARRLIGLLQKAAKEQPDA